MTSPMDPLDRQLEGLPTIRASNDFTAEVLRRLDASLARGFEPHRRRLVWAVVAAGIAALTLLAVLPSRNHDLDAKLTAEVTEIRRQHELLTQELNRLRARTEETAPVLFLGGVDEIDYVLDLSPFVLPPTGRVVPASSKETSTF